MKCTVESFSIALVLQTWLFLARGIISKLLCGKVTKGNCGKLRSPEHWSPQLLPLPLCCWDEGENMRGFFNEILISFWSHETRVWFQYRSLTGHPGPPDRESYSPSCNKGVNNPKHRPEFSSPGLVNASPSVIQVEFCLSKEVNAVAEEYYCSRLLLIIICLELEINTPSTHYSVVSCLEKNLCSTYSLLSVCFNPTTVDCVPLCSFLHVS